jgi:hypothetical protein
METDRCKEKGQTDEFGFGVSVRCSVFTELSVSLTCATAIAPYRCRCPHAPAACRSSASPLTRVAADRRSPTLLVAHVVALIDCCSPMPPPRHPVTLTPLLRCRAC